MAGLRGQAREPKAGARARRNSQNLSSAVDFIDQTGVVYLDGDGFIQLNLAASGGLENATAALQINLDTDPGLTLSSTGLKVLLPSSSGLQLAAGGLSIDLDSDPGLAISGTGLTTIVAAPIKLDGSGIGLNIGNGLELNGSNLDSVTRLLSVSTTDANTVSNTVTETAFTESYSIPANFLTVGKVLRVTASGKVSDTGAPDVTFRLKIGGTTVITHTLTLAGSTDDHWEFKHDIVCTATGGTGSVSLHDIWAVIAGILVDQPKATATVDTTSSNTLELTVQWSAADPGNTATMELFMVETLDQ